MKKNFALLIIMLIPFMMSAQNNDKKFTVEFGGFVRNDLMFNTRQNLSARGEGQFSLVPLPIQYDFNNEDINAGLNFNMAIINTRVNMKISGPDAFGAKTSAFVEGDFLGISAATKFNFRARHAYFKLDWEKSQVLTGMTWHPMFVTDCYPGTVSFNTGVPFNPLSRVPQIRFSYKLTSKISAFASIMSQGHFLSVAPANSFQNAGMPEAHIQLKFKSDNLAAGVGVNYQTLKPSLTNTGLDTAGNPTTYISNAKVSSLSFIGYVNLKTKPLTIKAWGMYGQNNDNLVMMGGYAAVNNPNPTAQQIQEGFIEYTPLNTLSTWLDLSTNGKKVKYGIFVGYAKNLGANKEINSGSYAGRWGNVNSMMRVSPRVVFISEKTEFGFEVEYSTIDYALGKTNGVTPEEITGINSKGQVTNFLTADNIKFLLSMTYKF